MPVTRSRNGPYDVGGLDGNNTARFLFGDEDVGDSRLTAITTSDESFPTLVRRDESMVRVNESLFSAIPSTSLHSADRMEVVYPFYLISDAPATIVLVGPY